MSTDYPFDKYCVICEGSFDDEKKWLKHFFKRGHKEAAWAQFGDLTRPSQFWLCPSRINRVVFVSSVHVSRFTILHHLTELGLEVTNCISLITKPTVAVVQFSEPNQVSRLFKNNKAKSSPLLKLELVNDDDKPKKVTVNVGRAKHSAGDSWKKWFRRHFDTEELKKKVKRACPSTEHDGDANLGPKAKKARALNERHIPLQNCLEESSPGSADLWSLDEQLDEIKSEIEIAIRDDKDPAWAILGLLEPLPLSKYPHAQFHQFRHWYHRLRSAGTNQLHLFILGDEFSTDTNPIKLIKRVLHGIKTELVNNSILSSRSLEDRLSLDCIYTLLSTGPFEFTVTSNPVYLPEVQACRMLHYLCEFDERVTPLLILLMYWSRSNGICLGATTESRLNFAPEPGALEWLVMFFLIEKRIIPSPRQVQARPHQPLFYQGSDLGFANTRHYVVERKYSKRYMDTMSNEFVLKVVQLAKEFLELVASCGKKNFVLNTKDGNKIPRDYFVGMSDEEVAAKGKMTVEEVIQVKELLANVPPDQIFIIHPLHALHSFSFNKTTVVNNHPKIMGLGHKMQRFLLEMKETPELGTKRNTLQNLFRFSEIPNE